MALSQFAKPDILQILTREDVELRQRGHRFWACCPLHTESTPSFCVNTERQRFKCFGCGAEGDVVDFIRQHRKLSFSDALHYLGISKKHKPIISNPRDVKKSELVKKFRRWEQLQRRAICELLRLSYRIQLGIKTPRDFELSGVAEMFHQRDALEYHLSILNGDDDKMKFELYSEVSRGR